MLNLPNLIGKGMEIAEDKPALYFYRWALDNLPEQEREWEDSLIHVSDYAVSIDEQDDKKCPRQLWLRYHGADRREPKMGEMLMWDQGTALQYRATYYIDLALSNDWYIYDIEMDLSDYLPKDDVGSADLVLHNKSIEKYIVVEIKTQRGHSFQFLEEPKPSHLTQLEGYLLGIMKGPASKAKGCVLYLDREGQNKPIQFNYQETQTKAGTYSELANKIISGEKPDTLVPKVDRRNNKGPDSVKVKPPWQCDYCKFQGISCLGALSDKLEGHGIIARIDNDNEVKMETESDELKQIITESLDI